MVLGLEGEEVMKYPSVTEILQPYADFSKVPPAVLEAAAERGTAVHAACAAYALGLWAPVPDELRGYFESFRAWFDGYVVEVLAVEEEIRHPKLGYIGHPDLICNIRNNPSSNPFGVIIDYKSPLTEALSWHCQIASYVEAAKEKYGVRQGGALMLRKDGGLPKMIWIDDHNRAFNAFWGALSAHNYLRGGK